MSIEVVNHAEHVEAMPSLNHSYICLQILRQLILDETIEPLPALTLDIANGITPDISIFSKGQVYPNLFHDVLKCQEKPVLAIEVVSSSQTIQEMLEKATQLIKAGVKTVWTVEPYSRSVFVTTPTEEQLFHGEKVESEGIKVDFSKVFSPKIQ
ncbi:MAG: Uma2 family endonuclease [Candidatus Competibacteraceae bacterium]